MNTTFQVGDIVTANLSVQGMVAGHNYKVVGIHVQSLPFGEFVSYQIQHMAGGALLLISNGHLLMSKWIGGAK